MANDLVLVKIDRARLLLAEAKNAQDAKKVADLAHAAEIYAKRQKMSGEVIKHARAIGIDAKTLLGDFLRAAPTAKGSRGGIKRTATGGYTNEPPVDDAPTLADLGLTKQESAESKLLSELKEEEPELHQAVKADELTIPQAKKKRNKKQGQKEKKEKRRSVHGAVIRLVHSDFEACYKDLGTFDLVIADPPYNVTNLEWDKLGSREEFVSKTREWLSLAKLCLKDKYHLFWFCSPHFSADVELVFRELDLPVCSRIVWHRRNMAKGSAAKNKSIDTWEMIFHSGNMELNFSSDWSDKWFDVQTFAAPQTNFKDEKLHPTQKPLDLIQRLVDFGSFEGGTVLDPFAGSGTTGEACQKLKRPCVLVEQSLDYCRVIRERLGLDDE